MADDREILREIWEGKIPICFSLAGDDAVKEQPEQFYILVPRHTYFPLTIDKVVRHFQPYTAADTNQENIWLDDQGTPLKWHFPVGVLFDISGLHQSLPWNLTIHFTRFPEDDVLRFPNKDAVEAMFMAVLKEADSLKHRGDIVTSMQKKDHKQLWLGLQNDKFDQFWSVNKRLMEKIEDKDFNHIPIRFHQEDKPYVQKLIKSKKEDGSSRSLKDVATEIIPEFSSDKKIVTQGIEVSLDADIQWLSEHFSYPDNFLHVCIVSA